MTDPAEELIACGRVGRAHGVQGAVLVEAWTDSAEARFAPGAVLQTSAAPLTVAGARLHSGRWIVTFEGVADRQGAEALRGTQLLVRRGDREPIEDPDEFYDSDLVGLRVRSVDGSEVGAVSAVLHGLGGDTLAVDATGREVLVPFVAAIVPTIDVGAGYVVVDPPEGLFDL